jgi:ribosomal protein S18 acetylase RimI-like enzyme
MVNIILVHSWIDVPLEMVAAYGTNHHQNLKWYIITPPKVRSDWVRLSQLMVNCLHDHDDGAASSNIFNEISWNIYQKHITQQQIYQTLVQNARAMQDMKYTILLAKEQTKNGKVIGMIEFGVSMIQHDNTSSFDPSHQRRLLMIGTIGIDPQYRNMGIASALIRQCETIVQLHWKETEIYAHIEETNHVAIRCFTGLGYTTTTNMNESGTTTASRIDFISVRRRHKVEYVPHLLFMKQLQSDRQI